MSDVIDRPILEQEKTAATRLRIIDCDVHPSIHAHSDLNEFLPKRWQEHLKTYGSHLRTPYIGTTPYPRSSPLIARRDAMTPARSAQAFAQTVKGACIVMIEGSGHNMMGEKPDEVLDALVAFLK